MTRLTPTLVIASAFALTLLAGCAASAPVAPPSTAPAVTDSAPAEPSEPVDLYLPEDWTECTYEQWLVTTGDPSLGAPNVQHAPETYDDEWESTDFPGANDLGKAPVCFYSHMADPGETSVGYAYFTGGAATLDELASTLQSEGWVVTEIPGASGGAGGFGAEYGSTLSFYASVITPTTHPDIVSELGDGSDLVVILMSWKTE